MPKRKRAEGESNDAAGDNASGQLSAREKRVRFKIATSAKLLGRAFKLAEGFERQKLGRRMRKAVEEQDQKRIDAVDAEIAAVKALDPNRAAQHHLCKSLMRIKAVAQHSDLPSEVREHGTLATDTPTLNVNARLCKSNPVQECMRAVLPDIQNSLGLVAESAGDGGKTVKVRAKDGKRAVEEEEEEEEEDGNLESAAPKRRVASSNSRGEGGLDKAAVRQQDGLEDDNNNEEDLERWDARIARSESDDENSAEDDVENLERKLALEGVRPKKPTSYSLEDDMDLSDAESAGSEPPEPRKARTTAPLPTSSSRTTTTTTKSSFIPSLTLGGYISGSGSDLDIDDDAAAGLDIAPRKNRRGQRARQKIWEQKFGTKANHLKNPKAGDSQGGGARGGWDAKRGAVDGSERGFGDRRKMGHSRGENSGGAGKAGSASRGGVGNFAAAAAAKKRDDDGPIHPSWEAAKKAKEKKEQPVAFQGKKITFE